MTDCGVNDDEGYMDIFDKVTGGFINGVWIVG